MGPLDGMISDDEEAYSEVDSEETIGGMWKSNYGSTNQTKDGSPKTSCLSKCFNRLPFWVEGETKECFKLVWTIAAMFFIMSIMPLLSFVFLRDLDKEYLDALGLGSTILSITGLYVIYGLATACDTFFAQAFGSANKKMVGVYVQRASMIIFLGVLPSLAIQMNSEYLLRLLGQDPVISRLAGDFVLYMMPTTLIVPVYGIFNKYLRTQNRVLPPFWSSVFLLISTLLMMYLFVNVLGMQILGSAIAQWVSYILGVTVLTSYVICSKLYKVTWGGLTSESFKDWGPFYAIAVAGLAQTLLQWTSYEVGTILSGLLGPVQLGAQTTIFQIEFVVYAFPLATGCACSMRMGQLLGANHPWLAKRSMYIAYSMVFCFCAVDCVLLLSLKDYLPMLFSSDQEVISTAATMMPVLALYHVVDSIVGVSMGILRGCGQQRKGAIIAVTGYYGVGLPVGIPLMMLTDLKFMGFWIGMCVGSATMCVLLGITLLRIDWQLEADKAQLRSGLKPSPYVKPTFEKGYQFVIEARDTGDPASSPLLQENDEIVNRPTTANYGTCTNIPEVRTSEENKLSRNQLILRRSVTALMFFMTLFIGIILRTNLSTDIIDVCVNSTSPVKPIFFTELPICNFTKGL